MSGSLSLSLNLIRCGGGKSGQPMIWTGGGMHGKGDCTVHDGINVTDRLVLIVVDHQGRSQEWDVGGQVEKLKFCIENDKG